MDERTLALAAIAAGTVWLIGLTVWMVRTRPKAGAGTAATRQRGAEPGEPQVVVTEFVKVLSGDRVDIGGMVSTLVGIAAPVQGQPGHEDSRRALEKAVRAMERVHVLDGDGTGGAVELLDMEGASLAERQVRQGQAWARGARGRYAPAQRAAQEARVGLWETDGAVAPWRWGEGR